MPPEAAARVQRLIRWVRARRKDLLAADDEISPSLLAVETDKKPSYWSDVLRYDTSNKSFGDKAARHVEGKLKMPPLYLEGIGWPFEGVPQERFDRLSERQKGRVEQAMLDAIAQIEAEQPPVAQMLDAISTGADWAAPGDTALGAKPKKEPVKGRGKPAATSPRSPRLRMP